MAYHGGPLLDATYAAISSATSGLAATGKIRVTFPATASRASALTAAGPCSNTSANNRLARAVLSLVNPVEGAKYNVNAAGTLRLPAMYPDAEGH
jgi:hypothetical protein